jgi:sodium-coupled neutral amino acid transporter 11
LLINIARVCFGLNMFTTLPLECFVCREVGTSMSSFFLYR